MKPFLRAAIGGAMQLSASLRRRKAAGLTIFVFHDVTRAPSPFAAEYGLYVEPERFERQIRWVASEFRLVHPDELGGRPEALAGGALITFDDGWAGAVANGLPILRSLNVPCLLFLNGRSVVDGMPMVPAITTYLSRHHSRFGEFLAARGLAEPYHLALTPTLLQEFCERHGNAWITQVRDYQGKLVDDAMLRSVVRADSFRLGSHLYEHWNSCALSDSEFRTAYEKNTDALGRFGGFRPLLAFPNGQPGIAYQPHHVSLARELGAARVFSGLPMINDEVGAYELHRISMTREDSLPGQMWYRLGKRHLLRAAPAAVGQAPL